MVISSFPEVKIQFEKVLWYVILVYFRHYNWVYFNV